jgi:hypothetical protein
MSPLGVAVPRADMEPPFPGTDVARCNLFARLAREPARAVAGIARHPHSAAAAATSANAAPLPHSLSRSPITLCLLLCHFSAGLRETGGSDTCDSIPRDKDARHKRNLVDRCASVRVSGSNPVLSVGFLGTKWLTVCLLICHFSAILWRVQPMRLPV